MFQRADKSEMDPVARRPASIISCAVLRSSEVPITPVAASTARRCARPWSSDDGDQPRLTRRVRTTGRPSGAAILEHLAGKTAVMAGTGIVGIAIGKVLQAFEHECHRREPYAARGRGLRQDDAGRRLIEAAAQADYLINILPASEDNIALFDAAVFAAMKPTAYYINVGRGQTIDESGADRGAARRPHRRRRARRVQYQPLPPDSPFWTSPMSSSPPISAATSSNTRISSCRS